MRGEEGGGGQSHIQAMKRCASGSEGGEGGRVLVGYRLQTPSGLGDSRAIKWESAGDAANLSGRHPASRLPLSPPTGGHTHTMPARPGLLRSPSALLLSCLLGATRMEIGLLRWKRSKAVKAGGAAQLWRGRRGIKDGIRPEREGHKRESRRERAGVRKRRGLLTLPGSQPRQ